MSAPRTGREPRDGVVVATVPKNSREELRVRLTEFRGHRLCDLRQFALVKAGSDRTPTRKGVAVNVALLPSLIAALQVAQEEARAAGWLPPGP